MTSDPMLLSAELFATGLLLSTSLSHIVAPRRWCLLFQDGLKHPSAGLCVGLLTLVVGLAVLIVHWRWTGDLRSVVTVLGWGWTVKGLLYMFWPQALAPMALRHVRHPGRMVAGGAVGLVLAGLAIVGIVTA